VTHEPSSRVVAQRTLPVLRITDTALPLLLGLVSDGTDRSGEPLDTITARPAAFIGDENASCAPVLFEQGGSDIMKDMRVHLEKLRADAADCALIRDLATEPTKRELFTRLTIHLETLAIEVERAITVALKK